MRAVEDEIKPRPLDGESPDHLSREGVVVGPSVEASADAGLVRDHGDGAALAIPPGDGPGRSRHEEDLVRAVGVAEVLDEDAVAVEEDAGSRHGPSMYAGRARILAFPPMRPLLRSSSALLAAALTGLAAAGYREDFPLPSVEAGDGLGFNINDPRPFVNPTTSARSFERLKATGAKWVRIGLEWRQTEGRAGVYDWGDLGRLLDKLQENRIRSVLILSYGNPVYGMGPKDPPRTAAQKAAFQRWVGAALARFGRRGHVWEIWNEPNYPFFWPNPDPAAYMELVNDTTATIRAYHPLEWIAGPGLSGIDTPFLEGCLTRGLLDKVDALSFHPYRQSTPETIIDDAARLRRSLSRFPKGATIPLFDTEWGYSLGQAVLTETGQRDLTLRLYALSLAGRIPLTCVFSWTDVEGTEIDNGRYGMVDASNRPRAVYEGLRTLGLQLAGFRYAGRIFTGDDRDFVLLYTTGRQEKIVAWTSRTGTFATTLPTAAGTFVVSRPPAAVGDSPRTERIVRTVPGLTVTLSGTPLVVTPLTMDSALRAIASQPPLPVSQDVGSPREIAPTLRSWMTLVRRASVGASLVVSDVSADSENGLVFRGSVAGTGNPAALVSVAEAEAFSDGLYVGRDRSDTPRRLVYEVTLPGRPTFRFESLVYPRGPLPLGFLPPTRADDLLVRVDNPLSTTFSGTLRVTRSNGAISERPFTVGATQSFVDIATGQPRGELQRGLKVQMIGGGSPVQPAVSRREILYWDYRNETGPLNPALYTLVTGRGTPVGLIAGASAGAPNPVLPGAPSRAVTLSYDVPRSEGSVHLTHNSVFSQLRTGVLPHEASMWVNGDGSGNGVCMAFSDAAGRYYQTKRLPLDFRGWRRLAWRMDRLADLVVNPGIAPQGSVVVHTPFLLVVDGNPVRRGSVQFSGITFYTRP